MAGDPSKYEEPSPWGTEYQEDEALKGCLAFLVIVGTGICMLLFSAYFLFVQL